MYPDGWPYEPTNMKYGISKIRISEITKGVYVPPVDEEADFTAMMVPGTVRVLRSHSL